MMFLVTLRQFYPGPTGGSVRVRRYLVLGAETKEEATKKLYLVLINQGVNPWWDASLTITSELDLKDDIAEVYRKD